MLQLMLGELLPVVTLGDPVVATLLLLLLPEKHGALPTLPPQVVVGSHCIDSSDFGLVLITPYQVTHPFFCRWKFSRLGVEGKIPATGLRPPPGLPQWICSMVMMRLRHVNICDGLTVSERDTGFLRQTADDEIRDSE